MEQSMEPGPAPTREERLAAKLRENLHRRKAQARAAAAPSAPAESPPAADRAAPLSKEPPTG